MTDRQIAALKPQAKLVDETGRRLWTVRSAGWSGIRDVQGTKAEAVVTSGSLVQFLHCNNSTDWKEYE